MLFRRAVWLLLPFGWVLACGGRFAQTTEEGDDQPSAGTSPATGATTSSGGSSATKAGTSSRGGKAPRGGASSRAGSTSAGGAIGTGATSSFGGTVSTAGSFGIAGTVSSGGGCACDPIGCAPPYRIVPNANGCCYHCEVDFAACQKAQDGYRQLRAQMEEKYSTLGCTTDTDCTLFWDKNECGASSCGVAMPNAAIMQLSQGLNSYAQQNCSFACPPQPEPPCAPSPNGPACIMNRCTQ